RTQWLYGHEGSSPSSGTKTNNRGAGSTEQLTRLTPLSPKLEAAWNSTLLTLLLVIAKILVAFFTGSLALFSQAADSGFDLVALFITIFAVQISSSPPDEDHPYGHGKFESLSALVQSLLLIGLQAWIIIASIGRLTG